jgi:hypothetical protein
MRVRRLLGIAVVGVIAVGLTSCTAFGSPDRDTVTSSSTAPAASESESAAATPTPGPEIAAASSKFDDANSALAASNADADDRDIVDALVAAGFEKGSMQITPDTTSIGRKADSIQVSVLVGSTCLLGQFRGATYVSETAPVLSTGRCLIGNTRAIDW